MRKFVSVALEYLLFPFSFLKRSGPKIKKGHPPIIILNAENTSFLPHHFRGTHHFHLKHFPSTIPSSGLQDTHMSGSAQYSKLQLSTMLAQLPSSVVLVDLRQESHGFINDGLAISWHGYRNWVNLRKSHIQAIREERLLLTKLLTQKNTTIHQLSKNNALSFDESDKEILPWKVLKISRAFTEFQLAHKLNVGYFRIPTPDHRKPSDKSIDRFLKFVKDLPPNTWLHFQCAAGDGRTTTFMILYDIIKNAKQVSWQDIVTRQCYIGPIDLARLPDPNHWRYKLSVERIEFIKKFHKYIVEVGDSFDPLWSEWVKKKS